MKKFLIKSLTYFMERCLMRKKYNLALLPTTLSETFIELSHHLTEIADQYSLGKNSLPHVTLCQFFAKESDIHRIWSQVNTQLSKNTIELIFTKLGESHTDGYQWVTLLPNVNAELIQMHHTIAEIVKLPLNKSYKNYYPHLTLANIQKKYETQALPNDIKNLFAANSMKDTFKVALGACDEAGQFTRVIY